MKNILDYLKEEKEMVMENLQSEIKEASHQDIGQSLGSLTLLCILDELIANGSTNSEIENYLQKEKALAEKFIKRRLSVFEEAIDKEHASKRVHNTKLFIKEGILRQCEELLSRTQQRP